MNKKMLEKILKDKKEIEKAVSFFLRKKLLFKRKGDRFEIQGHLEKAKHNLKFVNDNFKLGYFDWVITGCYYAVYHAALSLILSRGYFSKNHDASLSILIREFYKDFVFEFEFVNNLFIDYNEVIFYLATKEKRELASYSSSFIFSKETVKEIIEKTIKFVNKSEEILNE